MSMGFGQGEEGPTDLGETAFRDLADPPDEAEWIDRYRLLEVIGEGGMGLVYRAEQREPVRRRVALKLVKLGMDTRRFVARFEAERQALALMEHPGIAAVLDGGATATGRPYFVMEYVKGLPIHTYCDRHRLPTQERLELFLKVCEAVEHAHQKGIIHRDLKPSNILVTELDGKPVPKVIDFGVAKTMSLALTEKTLHTQFGGMIGTPAYMSPEQADRPQDSDTRADVYSLGVVLYELLTGVLPFEREQLDSAGVDEIRRVIREVDPPRPSTRLSSVGETASGIAENRGTQARDLVRRLSGDLDWVTMKALEKNRSRRYSSVGELAADISRHLEHRPVLAGPPSWAYRARKLLRRRRGTAIAAAFGVMALVVGSWGVWGWWQSARAAELAQRFGQDVGSLEWRLRVAHMSPLHDLTDEYRSFENRLEGLESQMEELGAGARSPGTYAIGRGLLALDRPDEALPWLDEAWERGLRSPQLAFARGVALGRVYRVASERAKAARDPERRERLLQEAQESYRDQALAALTEARSTPEAPLPYVDALIAFLEEDYDETFAQIDRALTEAPWLWEAYKLRGDAWAAVAASHYEDNQRAAGHEADRQSQLAFAAAVELAPSAPEAWVGSCTRALFRLFQWRFDKTDEELFEDLLATARLTCGNVSRVLPEHPEAAANLANVELMAAHRELEGGGDPTQTLLRARRFAEQSLARSPESALALKAFGDSLMNLGRYRWERTEDARELLEQAGEAYARAAELVPSSQAWNNGANAFLLKGRQEIIFGVDPTESFKSALEWYGEAAKLSPRETISRANSTLVLRDLAEWEADTGIDPRKRLQEAARIADELVLAAPKIAFLHIARCSAASDLADAEIEWGDGDPWPFIEKGRNAFEVAIDLQPGTHGPYWSLAQIEKSAVLARVAAGEDPTVEVRAFEAALDEHERLFPENARAHRVRAEVHMELAKHAAARSEDPMAEVQAGFDEAAVAERLSPSEAVETQPVLVELHRLALESAPDRETALKRMPAALEIVRRFDQGRALSSASLVTGARLWLWQARLSRQASERAAAAEAARFLLGLAVERNPRLEEQRDEVLEELDGILAY